jgi:hypothetical protein
MPRSNRKPPPDTATISVVSPAVKITGKKKKATPETIVLDDNDDYTPQGLHAQYEASAIQAFADDKKNNNKNKESPAPAGARSSKRIKKSNKKATAAAAASTPASAVPSVPDAIDVDDMTSIQSNDPSVLYRRILGPLRFDFIDSFRHHNFLNEKQHPSMQKLMPRLYKELLEYRLNLPSEVSGSIFVRTLESRMDIIRALITGESVIVH